MRRGFDQFCVLHGPRLRYADIFTAKRMFSLIQISFVPPADHLMAKNNPVGGL